jgi:hypothetical protein
VANGYDTYLRLTKTTALGSGVLNRAVYGYDNASRLSSVSDGNSDSATYSYIANSSLVGQIVFQQSSTTRMTTTQEFDYLNRLSSISWSPTNLFGYLENAANAAYPNHLPYAWQEMRHWGHI